MSNIFSRAVARLLGPRTFQDKFGAQSAPPAAVAEHMGVDHDEYMPIPVVSGVSKIDITTFADVETEEIILPKPAEAPESNLGQERAPRNQFDDLNADYIQSGFERFHADNPEIYRKLVDLAMGAKANGHKGMGISLLWERLRWHFTVEVKDGENFKLNNNYRSRYARLIMRQEPSLAGFFKTRALY